MFLKKIFKGIAITAVACYVLLCGLLYFYQETLLFFPEKLERDYQFQFKHDFEERDIITDSGNSINTLLFKQENSKGVIFYLHGNGGSLKSVGNVSEHFLPLGYDVFMIDYPGYGKSSSVIENEQVLYEDVQDVYEDLKTSYSENKIIILGYSMGTGIAAHLASNNSPDKLVLHAPFYNMTDMMNRNYPFVPTFILRYELATNRYLKECDFPVYLFHGVEDQIIPLESSEMLSSELHLPLYKLSDQGHNDMAGNKEALKQLKQLLND
ncbi:alpha/beta hydrolase [uncultured Nonlabens sp.]|uniref:alpha/beta hydrolase n=1 Tax=uncultured Nonlabens sp. TaxID=859306 RepID=UPI00262F4324|nr:alpha/beta hydrolase [uncultured Nonlabens sp.]